MSTYDLREAKEMIGIAAGKLGARDGREAAQLQLVEALLGLNGVGGLNVELDPEDQQKRDVYFSLGRNSAHLSWNHRDGHHLHFDEQVPIPVPFEVDIDAKKFVAFSPNQYVAPRPGEPVGMRDATAVIIEMILRHWKLLRR